MPLAMQTDLPKTRRGMRPGTPSDLVNLHRRFLSEYRTWSSMRSRCRNPKSQDYAMYGGRGIAVCERWNSFAAFLSDMGQKPTPKHSIDRIDGDGNYEPSNCRWATPKEQASNWRYRNRRLEFRGETLSLDDWAARIGLTRESLRDRLNTGWSAERALTTPPTRQRRRMADGTFAPVGD